MGIPTRPEGISRLPKKCECNLLRAQLRRGNTQAAQNAQAAQVDVAHEDTHTDGVFQATGRGLVNGAGVHGSTASTQAHVVHLLDSQE